MRHILLDSEVRHIVNLLTDIRKNPGQTVISLKEKDGGTVCVIKDYSFYFYFKDIKISSGAILPENLMSEIQKGYPGKNPDEILNNTIAEAIKEIYDDSDAPCDAMHCIKALQKAASDLSKRPVTRKCKHSFPRIMPGDKTKLQYVCLKDAITKNDERPVCQEDCENCQNYDCRNITYPITVNGIVYGDTGIYRKPSLCRVRPCAKEYNDKTYLGIFLGELMMAPTVSHIKRTGVLEVNAMHNPCIFIPELMRIVWGCESWWSEIKSEKDLKDISDDTINSQWYVKMLQGMSQATAPEKEGDTSEETRPGQ